MEEEEGIGVVLARATELRLKISDCAHKARTATELQGPSPKDENGVKDDDAGTGSHRSEAEMGEDEADDDKESERLMNISDALESLETQLSSLQALQQQQQYEKEAALAEIEHSRKILLDKLKEYKGKDLEVIHEASTFAGETVDQHHDLMLPPYPTHPPNSHFLDNGCSPQFPSARKFVNSAIISTSPPNEPKRELGELEKNNVQNRSGNSKNGLRSFIGTTAKTVLTVVGVASVLSLFGFGLNFVKGGKGSTFKFLDFLQQPADEEKRIKIDKCPPGKILVMEDGEARCIVKERIEVPFSSVVAKPDVNYGCG